MDFSIFKRTHEKALKRAHETGFRQRGEEDWYWSA